MKIRNLKTGDVIEWPCGDVEKVIRKTEHIIRFHALRPNKPYGKSYDLQLDSVYNFEEVEKLPKLKARLYE